jgi:hypothetical protein
VSPRRPGVRGASGRCRAGERGCSWR